MEPQIVKVRIPLAIGAVASVLVLAGLVVALSADAGHHGPKCAGQDATIVRGDGAQTITGTNHKDVIVAGDGPDAVNAGGGNDVVCGGKGGDDLHGDDGSDKVLEGAQA